MKDFIEALTIFLKYGDLSYPTHCEHDELTISGHDGVYHKDRMTAEDVTRLDELGFFWSDEEEYFKSFKYGSC